MKLTTHEISFNGGMLARGFWLYVWEITTSGGKVYYVGRTGDSSSLNAQSPFARISQHLGMNRKSNALRKNLENRQLSAEECQKFRIFACGPIFQESRTKLEHTRSRDIVAALEKALADSMSAAGYDVLNEVKCRISLNEKLWKQLRRQFAKTFQKLS
ncbi:MAG TPA: hypothetical protein VK810_04900 [Dongiaceae bacterium]|jgi:hypothetical protein|nr:hypothetical protein [Dongiaceae bacterium]